MNGFKFLRNAAGISLVEVMMAVSVVGGLSLTVAQLMKNTSENVKQNEAKSENINLKAMVQDTLGNTVACYNSFNGIINAANLTAMTGTGRVTVPNIKDKGNVPRYSTASTNLAPLTITSISLTNYLSSAGTADLLIEATFKKSTSVIVMVKPIRIPINLSINGSSALVSCSAMAVGGEWLLGGNAGTVDGTDYLGTSDNQPLNLKVNNQNAGRIDTTPTTFFGYQAGRVTTSGIDNTGFGYKALEQSSGRYSVAFGDQALALNGTGQYNTAIGSRALSNSLNAGHNTAVGAQALRYLTSGGSNVALGSNAMFSNTTGAQNVALGVMTLRANIGGGNNTGIGTNALYVNTSGGSNTALGVSALGSNVGGSYNVALGSNSGSFNTNGQYNTYVGHVAGNNLTTGSNNIFLGYAAGTGVMNSSNKLYIEATTSTTPLISGDFSARTVQLSGTTTINVPAYTIGLKIPNLSGIRSVGGLAADKIYIDSRTLFRDAASGGTGFVGIAGGLGIGGGSYWDGSVVPAQGNAHIQGNVGIGTQAPAHKLHVVGNIYTSGEVRTAGGTKGCPTGWWCNAFFWDVSTQGIYYTNLNNTSDRRLKKNIKDLDESFVQKLLKLNPVQFEWRKDKKTGRESKGIHYGFIAQEVEAIWPQLVSTSTDEVKTKSLAGTELISPLVEAFQFLHAQVAKNQEMFQVMHDGLEEQVKANTKAIVALEEEVKDLKLENKQLRDRLKRIEKALNIK